MLTCCSGSSGWPLIFLERITSWLAGGVLAHPSVQIPTANDALEMGRDGVHLGAGCPQLAHARLWQLILSSCWKMRWPLRTQ
eukprot:2110809-Amphidinium_carterae.1